ncbi:MAG: PLDc N-terminal domain-containing protein [Rhodospirillaceae bacterium]|jgi:cardiolipin synthase|nr:PLDc N-terminal domain-containing protein [Rhodospirillaceae bacterium]
MIWTPIDSVLAWLGTLLHVGLAAAVTLHALLKKRDVAAAIAWIGLAWLSPIVGPVLYVVFGINRIERKARRLRSRRGGLWIDDPATFAVAREDHLAPLQHAIGVLTRRPPRDGTALSILRNGDEAYPPMLAAIDGAERSVCLVSYIFDDDEAGSRFVDALIAAHRRGVQVRVIVDGIGSGYFRSPAHARLAAAGVPAARFLHSFVPWRTSFFNLRNHKKILAVDGARAFIGGINIQSENVLALNPAWPVRDMHFGIAGPVVGQIVEAFAADWHFCTGEDLKGPAWFPQLGPAGPASARVITSGPDDELERIGLAMIAAVGVAQRSIQIITPYFLPDARFVSALGLAAMRGVAVDIVLPEKCDHRLLDWAMAAHIPPLIASGVRFWRAALPFEHSKLMAVDQAWSLIGSANWDMRSLRLNFEITLEVCCPIFSRLVGEAITAKQDHRILAEQLDARPLWAQLRDSAARLLLPYL